MHPERSRGSIAEDRLRRALSEAGWRARDAHDDADGPDLIITKNRLKYAVEIKTAAEARADRLIPLWSQAYLQARRYATAGQNLLVIVAAPSMPERTAEQVLRFAAEHAPDAAAGVLDFDGFRRFQGQGLDSLNAEKDKRSSARAVPSDHAADLFSDLNQWMLKVLLAPEIPVALLNAPRDRYRNASELATAAEVSQMSVSRFVRAFAAEGFLEDAGSHLGLVRRKELFRRWSSAVTIRRPKEVPLRALLRGDRDATVRSLVRGDDACLGLFAAADALRLGHVHGVPPYVYVRRLDGDTIARWPAFLPAAGHEAADVIVRQAPTPQSIFRGAIRPRDVHATDVLQIWLDVSGHPTRGSEQAEFLRRRVLSRVIDIQ